MDKKEIGKFIQTLRKKKKLTQSELAELIGVTDKAISRWETGEGFPEITLLPQLSIILGVSVDDILAGKVEEKEVRNNKNSIELFKLHQYLIHVIIWFGAIFSVTMFFITLNYIWNFVPFIVCILGASIYFLIARYHFIKISAYNDEDKMLVGKSLKYFLLSLVLSILMILPIYAVKIHMDINGITAVFPISFNIYWWVALIFMGVGYLIFVGVEYLIRHHFDLRAVRKDYLIISFMHLVGLVTIYISYNVDGIVSYAYYNFALGIYLNIIYLYFAFKYKRWLFIPIVLIALFFSYAAVINTLDAHFVLGYTPTLPFFYISIAIEGLIFIYLFIIRKKLKISYFFKHMMFLSILVMIIGYLVEMLYIYDFRALMPSALIAYVIAHIISYYKRDEEKLLNIVTKKVKEVE